MPTNDAITIVSEPPHPTVTADVPRASGSQAIERALSLLACFTHQTPSLPASELATRTGLTAPTVYRILKALERERYVLKHPHTGWYSVGPGIVELAQVPIRRATSGDVVGLATPYLDALRTLTAETVGLNLLLDGYRICVAERESHELIRMASGVGRMRELGAGAAGKVIAAYLVERGERYPGSHSLDDAEAAVIRAQGWAISLEEVVAGASAFAVPVRSANGSILGCINITGPLDRWTRERMDGLKSEILAQGASLEAELGFRGSI